MTLTSTAVFVPQSEWPQVADAVIEARQTIHTHIRLTKQRRCSRCGNMVRVMPMKSSGEGEKGPKSSRHHSIQNTTLVCAGGPHYAASPDRTRCRDEHARESPDRGLRHYDPARIR